MTDTTTADVGTPRAAPDLSTRWLGLPLRTPLVASAGPLTARIETLEALEEAQIAAVVLPSLFEEEVVREQLETNALLDRGAGANPEADGYFPDVLAGDGVVERHLRLVRGARDALSIPVIGSINGTTPGGWVDHAQRIVDEGVDALELNLYEIAADPLTDSHAVESHQLRLVEQVRDAVDVPLAVKVGPHYTAFASMARRLVDAGADGLVLFNRFYQPDIDPHALEARPTLELSRPSDLRMAVRWTALLADRIDTDIGVTGGVHDHLDVARVLLAGADVAMMTAALLVNGPDHVLAVEQGLDVWMREMEFDSVAQLKGSMSQSKAADAGAYERANYIASLKKWTNSFHELLQQSPSSW